MHDQIYKYYYLFLFHSQNCGRCCIFYITPFHFHNSARFCIFEHFTNSCFCHVFVRNTAFVTIPEFENNQEFKPKHDCLIIEYHNFW